MSILKAIRHMIFSGQTVPQETFIVIGSHVVIDSNDGNLIFGKVAAIDLELSWVYVAFQNIGMWVDAQSVDTEDTVMMRLAA